VATTPGVKGGPSLQQLVAVSTHNDFDPHDTALISSSLWYSVTQPAALPVGFAEARTLPSAPAATHSDAVGHETPVRPCLSIGVTFHAVAPPVGSLEVTASPTESAVSTATHSDTDGQETAIKLAWQSSPGPYLPHSGGIEVGA
jgi:hypothetical protein